MIIGRRQTDGAGYMFADDRCSGGGLKESDMLGCNHCQKLMEAHKWKEDGGWCGCCGQPVCGPCSDKILTEGCVPFIKKVDKQIEENYKKKQLARMLGV